MSARQDLIKLRTTNLRETLKKNASPDLFWGNFFYLTSQMMVYISFILSGIAAAIGFIPYKNIEKWEVSLVAAAAAGLLFMARESKFEQRAQWYYKRSDGLRALMFRLDYELSIPPKEEEVAAVSKDFRSLVETMTEENVFPLSSSPKTRPSEKRKISKVEHVSEPEPLV